MIAKLAGPAPTRTAAEQARAKAAGETQVWPVKTNAGFLARAARHPDFVEGNIDTGFIERHADQLIPPAEPDEAVLSAAAARSEEHTSELQSLMRISYAVFCLKKKTHNNHQEQQAPTTITP